ncbi:MAG: glycosyltransferase family 2 protein [Anaerolineae bacterium]|nr:glycosyltransferase family 2 protein [Anaerolineae bacterium]
MEKLLTIAIPTFNRAQLLNKQLGWLAQAVKCQEAECEVIISDNCSSDETPQVVQKWREKLGSLTLKLNRNSENIGAIRNIAYCMKEATGRFVWVISDDDEIGPDTLTYVLHQIKTYPDLALLILNFSSYSITKNELVFDRCFDVADDNIWTDGTALFERYLAEPEGARWGGLALTTALVYRTDLAQRALAEWPAGVTNLTFQLYITGYCARHGSVKITKETYLQCMAGTHFFLQDRKMFFAFRYAEVPEIFIKLMKIGYSPDLCRRKVLEQRREFKRWLIKQCFKAWPVFTTKILVRYAIAVCQVIYFAGFYFDI